VGYRSSLIKITDEIAKIESGIARPLNPSFYNEMKFKMAHASAICRENEDASILMRLAVTAIQRERETFVENAHESIKTPDDDEISVHGAPDSSEPNPFLDLLAEDQNVAFRSAYIVRQIKRPEEVVLLRQIYGPQFILISAYGSGPDRQKALEDKIRSSSRTPLSDSKSSFLAAKLIESDMNEDRDSFGQHMRDTFHLADVVIEGLVQQDIYSDLDRFISALFGSNEIAPTRDEYGMNAAFGAALRSSDLSRQIGAVIFSRHGELLSQGCNEVPKAFGGTYWDNEEPDYRDVKLGRDSNDILKMDVLQDLFDKMKKGGILAPEIASKGSSSQIAEFLVGRGVSTPEDEKLRGVLSQAKILDLTEYGRVVHAEMSAICDAARVGTSIRMGTLFTTTFPCHNCTKHILAAGIQRVVYLEPYPKSKAKELHSNEIVIEGSEEGKVSFQPFRGITPGLYRRIFAKGKRKRDGIAVRWQHGSPAPMISVMSPDYLRLENLAKTTAAELGLR
jgi:deoxycytidylate deaminase